MFITNVSCLDWLAQLITHIPNRGEQMVRCYGYYSNKSQGMRKKAGTDEKVPDLIESETSSKEFRKNWARLIQKVYNTDPLICPKCDSGMRFIAFIEDAVIIKKILLHLNLWDTHNHDPPSDKIITGYVPEVQEERIKFAANNHTQVFFDNECYYYEDPPFYDEGSQVTYGDSMHLLRLMPAKFVSIVAYLKKTAISIVMYKNLPDSLPFPGIMKL